MMLAALLESMITHAEDKKNCHKNNTEQIFYILQKALQVISDAEIKEIAYVFRGLGNCQCSLKKVIITKYSYFKKPISQKRTKWLVCTLALCTAYQKAADLRSKNL